MNPYVCILPNCLSSQQMQVGLNTKGSFIVLIHTQNALSTSLIFAHSEHLRQIADLLRECPALLGKIVSSDRSSQILPPWIRLICSQRPNTDTLELWTEVIANSCTACPNNHGLKATLQQWEKVQLARKALKGDDSVLKLDGSLRTTDISHDISSEVKITASILSQLCNSMPCRRCFARFRDPAYIATLARVEHPASQCNAIPAVELYGLDLEDVLFGQSLGPWKIVLSAQALRDLQRSKSQGNFHLVWAKLKDLSTGDWVRRSVAEPLTLGSVDLKVRLFVASYCTKGGILWQVDTAYDLRVCSHSQVVKVWRIGGSDDDVTHAAKIVAQTQRHWSEARVNRCKVNQLDRAKGLKVAATFPDLDDEALPAEPEIDPPEIEPPEIKSQTTVNLLISSRFHALTDRIFDNILSGNQYAEFAFDLNAKVVDIVKHFKTAAFILGRSGTGKTTCLLYKLLSRYLASHMVAAEDKDCLRQILVTRSKQLAKKLHVELNALVNAQLLDYTQNKPRSAENTAENWDGASEATNESLFTLKQNQFPLVCTFAHFLRLIENTIRENDKQKFAIREQKNVSEFVDFHFFKKVYWPHLSYQSASQHHLEAGIVFSEIMGVIKGAASMRNGLKPLSKDEYLTRSPTLAPAFPTPVMREMIFNLYSQYERRRKQRGDEDAMDQMINILHGVRRYGLEKRLRNIIHEIYVDEVQDQRPIEIELFLDLVENPLGIHFAGDSAQCISNDSAFRFANVKALFFDRYSNTKYELAKPTLFSLSRNHRSHQGILKFASFVMSLLWKGFPTMVDNLGPEISMAWGDKPVIFVGACVTDLLAKVSGLAHVGSDDHASSVGSNKQVVIVRDDITRSQLESILDKQRMVYTILESKGMEYDDVFLYNFFQSSPCSAAMRTLEELLPDQVNDRYAEGNLLMCSELKKLYVAITRPRHRLWILETSPSSILDLLTKLPKPLVDIKYINHDHLSRIASTLRPTAETTTEDWIQTGHQCMENKLYDRAIHCFEKAGDSGIKLKNWANACYYEQSGREQRANGDMHSFRKSFKEAANLFRDAGMLENASGCLEALGDYAEAAEMWSTNKQHERAANLFEKAGILFVEKAAGEYYAACLPSKALSLLYKERHFESVIEGLTTWPYQR
ncbi:P-loop containing nucleoside triphosphate hydrolase protein [Kalaharituber pfeilii]|nr:P-loop containing nucleoside triphosphate hydrolase protein [Kalaharituber pfeilii]